MSGACWDTFLTATFHHLKIKDVHTGIDRWNWNFNFTTSIWFLTLRIQFWNWNWFSIPNPLRCKATFTHFCYKMKTILVHTGVDTAFQKRTSPSILHDPSPHYVTIHAHCSIMLHKTINKIYIPLLLKTHFKPPSSVCNNFRLPSNVCFGHVMFN